MRPTYQTHESVSSQARFASALAGEWGVELTQLHSTKRLDYAVERDGRMLGFLELKERSSLSLRYGDYMISQEKYLHGVMMTKLWGLKFVIAVKFRDRDLAYEYTPERNAKTYIRMGGRRDRGDEMDVEPMVMIPMELFVDVGEVVW